MPSSYAARNARMAISPRLATSTLLNTAGSSFLRGLLLRIRAAGLGDLGGTLPGGTRSDPCEDHPGGVPRRRAPPSSPGGDAAVPADLRRRVRRWATVAGGVVLAQATGGRAALRTPPPRARPRG